MRISDWSSDVCSSGLAVIPEPGGRVVRTALRVELFAGRRLERGFVFSAPGLSLRFERIATHGREHVGGLFTAHHRDLRVRPGPKEARRICTTAHAVVAGAVRAADQHREFRHLRSEEHTSELQSLMRISYAVFCLKKKNIYIVT